MVTGFDLMSHFWVSFVNSLLLVAIGQVKELSKVFVFTSLTFSLRQCGVQVWRGHSEPVWRS